MKAAFLITSLVAIQPLVSIDRELREILIILSLEIMDGGIWCYIRGWYRWRQGLQIAWRHESYIVGKPVTRRQDLARRATAALAVASLNLALLVVAVIAVIPAAVSYCER